MTTKPSYTPALRIPDFLNDGDWEVKRLGEIVKEVEEKCSIGKLDIDTYISTENMLQNLEGVKKASKLPETGSFTRFQKGDILFSNIRPYLKKVWQAEFEGAASNDVIVFRAQTEYDSGFVSQIIKSDSFIAHTMAGAKGVKMPRGDKNMMLEYPVCVPCLPEQRRIAACLSALDEMLAATNGKLEQLKAYKKGLMQQLFANSTMGGGKSLKINYLQIPKLRFPEFYQEKEWEEKKLGEIIITITPKKKMQTGDYKLTGKHPIIDQSQSYICGYCDDDAALANSNSEQMIVFGDHTCTLKFVDFPFIQGADGIKVFKSSNSNVVDERFLYQFLLFKPIVSKEYKRHFSELKEKTVCLPVNVSEQRKIASCLSAMDETINAYTEKVGLLGQYKKGLMQGMFVNTACRDAKFCVSTNGQTNVK